MVVLAFDDGGQLAHGLHVPMIQWPPGNGERGFRKGSSARRTPAHTLGDVDEGAKMAARKMAVSEKARGSLRGTTQKSDLFDRSACQSALEQYSQ